MPLALDAVKSRCRPNTLFLQGNHILIRVPNVTAVEDKWSGRLGGRIPFIAIKLKSQDLKVERLSSRWGLFPRLNYLSDFGMPMTGISRAAPASASRRTLGIPTHNLSIQRTRVGARSGLTGVSTKPMSPSFHVGNYRLEVLPWNAAGAGSISLERVTNAPSQVSVRNPCVLGRRDSQQSLVPLYCVTEDFD